MGQGHIIVYGGTQSPREGNWTKNDSLLPLLPPPSTHVDVRLNYNDSFRTTYWGENPGFIAINGTMSYHRRRLHSMAKYYQNGSLSPLLPPPNTRVDVGHDNNDSLIVYEPTIRGMIPGVQ